MVCKYFDHFYTLDGGCWKDMNICSTDEETNKKFHSMKFFDCPKMFALSRGYKLRWKLQQEVPKIFKNCFNYNFKTLP